MVNVHQRWPDFFVRYVIVDADRQGVTGHIDWPALLIAGTLGKIGEQSETKECKIT